MRKFQRGRKTKAKNPAPYGLGFFLFNARAVPTLTWGDPTLPSALRRFTSEFGMGSGGTTAPKPPTNSDNLYQAEICLFIKHLRRCKVKPHGSLVSVSSTHRCAYTPDLSTSSSSTFLQDSQRVRRTHLGEQVSCLDAFQHLSLPHLATGQCHWHDKRTPVMRPSGPLVLRSPLNSPAPTADRDRTVS